MITRKEHIEVPSAYLPLLSPDLSGLLFFDIDTTGFQSSANCVYEIGMAYAASSGWIITQYLIQSEKEEPLLLRTFAAALSPYTSLISFNGDTFDIPFLESRYRRYGLSSPLVQMKSIDMYREVRKYRNLLDLHSLNQKSMEKLAGYNRLDQMDGGGLIKVFHTYCKSQDSDQEALLLLHNHDDVAGMFSVTSLYAYGQLFSGSYTIETSVMSQNETQLEIHAFLPLPLPSPFSVQGAYGAVSASQTSFTVTVPVINGNIRYYHEDYKNYYYLPKEDMAVHKKIGSYVDPQYRVKADRDNCYTWWQITPERLSDPASLIQLCDSVLRCALRGNK